MGVGADRQDGDGLYDVLSGDVQAADAVRPTAVERLSLLASTPDLAGATMELPRLAGSERRLRDALAPVRDALRLHRCSTARLRSDRSPSTRSSPPTA